MKNTVSINIDRRGEENRTKETRGEESRAEQKRREETKKKNDVQYLVVDQETIHVRQRFSTWNINTFWLTNKTAFSVLRSVIKTQEVT